MKDKINPIKIREMDFFHNNKVNYDKRNIKYYDSQIMECSDFKSIDEVLSLINKSKEEIKWIDYCCGYGIAILEGTKRYNDKNSNLVSSLGIDIRKFDGLEYLIEPEFVKGKVRFFQHDLEEGVLNNLSADFISCIKGLLYIEDPVKIIQQMYNQLNEEGYLFFTLNTNNSVMYGSTMFDSLASYIGRHMDNNKIKHYSIISDHEIVFFLQKQDKVNFNPESKFLRSIRDPNTGWKDSLYIKSNN